jgi:hypothetical protein
MRNSGYLVLLLIGASVITSPVFGEERADNYPIENGGGATAYCLSDRGLQLSPGGKVIACIYARNAPVVAFQMEGGSIGSAYCLDGRNIAFSPVNGKLKSCTISYAIKGLSVSGASIQCPPESVAQFREDGYIISCGKDTTPTGQSAASTHAPTPATAPKNNDAVVCASLMTAIDAHAKKYASPGCIVRLEFMQPYTYQNGECVGANKTLSRCPQQDNIEREISVFGSKDNPMHLTVGAIRQQYEKEYPHLSWGREPAPAQATKPPLPPESPRPPASGTGSPEGVTVKAKIVKDDIEQLEAGVFFQAALVNMISKFVDARLETDALLKTDFNKSSVPQWNAEYDKTAIKWKTADQAIKHYQQTVAKMPETRLARLQAQEWQIAKVAQALTRGELLAVYDAAPPGMKLATVAAILNVDMNTANKILQDVREGVNKHLGNVADANQRVANALSVISTGSKVLITVGSIAATGGGSLALSGSLATKAVAAGEIGAVAVNGADLVLEVSEVAVNIGVKDPARQHALVTTIKNARAWKPLTGATYVLTVMDLAKMFKGLNHVMDRREAWLNTAGKSADAKKLEYEKALKEFGLGMSGNLLSITDFIQTQDPAGRFVVVPDTNGKSLKILPMSGLVKLESYIKDSREAIKKLNLSPEQAKIMEDALSKYAEMRALSMPSAPEPTSCSGLGYKDCRETPGCTATFSTTWYVCCRESEAVDGFCPKPN